MLSGQKVRVKDWRGQFRKDEWPDNLWFSSASICTTLKTSGGYTEVNFANIENISFKTARLEIIRKD